MKRFMKVICSMLIFSLMLSVLTGCKKTEKYITVSETFPNRGTVEFQYPAKWYHLIETEKPEEYGEELFPERGITLFYDHQEDTQIYIYHIFSMSVPDEHDYNTNEVFTAKNNQTGTIYTTTDEAGYLKKMVVFDELNWGVYAQIHESKWDMLEEDFDYIIKSIIANEERIEFENKQE